MGKQTYHTPTVTPSVLSNMRCRVLLSPKSDGSDILMKGGHVTLFKKANSVIIPGLNFKYAGTIKYMKTNTNPKNWSIIITNLL